MFVGIFTIECILKILGIGFATYISDKSNTFDFVIVIGSLLGLAKNLLPLNITALRLLRAVRLLRLAKSSQRI